MEPAAVVVSELASNAVLHARSPFAVDASWQAPRLRVEVTDMNPTYKRTRPRLGRPWWMGPQDRRRVRGDLGHRPTRGSQGRLGRISAHPEHVTHAARHVCGSAVVHAARAQGSADALRGPRMKISATGTRKRGAATPNRPAPRAERPAAFGSGCCRDAQGLTPSPAAPVRHGASRRYRLAAWRRAGEVSSCTPMAPSRAARTTKTTRAPASTYATRATRIVVSTGGASASIAAS